MALAPKNNDSLNRCYTGKIHLYDGMDVVVDEVSDFLGHLKRVDFARATKDSKLTKRDRMLILKAEGVSDVIAKSIVSDNDAQVSLMWRTFRDNRRQWHLDVNRGTKRQKARAEQRLKKDRPSVVLGGKKLWLTAQKDSEAMELFKKKRKWWGAIGRSMYVNKDTGEITNFYRTNQAIRVLSDGTLCVNIPPAMRASFRSRGVLGEKDVWLTIGTVKYGHGWDVIRTSIEEDRSITHHIEWNKNNKLVLRSQTQIDTTRARHRTTPRVVAIDTNSRRLDVSIVDAHGNRVGKSRTFSFENAKDIPGVVEKIAQYAEKMGATAIVAEDLTGIQRGITRSNKRALNRVLSKIPTGAVKRALVHVAEKRGWDIAFVDPAYTSQKTVQWVDTYSGDTHQLASFLIGRRGLGLHISRRRMRKVNPGDSGRLVSHPRTDSAVKLPSQASHIASAVDVKTPG